MVNNNFIVKFDSGYVYKTYKGNIHYSTDAVIYYSKEKANRITKRLSSMGISSTIVEKGDIENE